MKKTIAILLALMMLSSLAVAAFAEAAEYIERFLADYI